MFIKNFTVGIIDSGIGGLKLAKQILKDYPYENIVYFADDKFMPYGNKTKQEIVNRIKYITNYLIENYNIKILILACNTASLTSLDYLKLHYKIPVIGVFPYTYNDSLVLCTKLSYKQLNTNKLYVKNLASKIEQYYFNKVKLENYIYYLINKYKLSSYSGIVLGCTHYELIGDIFEKLMPNCSFFYPTTQTLLQFKQIYEKYQFSSSSAKFGQICLVASSNNKSYINKLTKILEKYL